MSESVFVPGTPVPQGSTKGFVINGRAKITSANKKTKPWRADVAAHVRDVIGPEIRFPSGPVTLHLQFVLPRRVAEPKRVTPPHTRKPDMDKLIRAIFDALSGLVYTDDAQVVELQTTKRTAVIAEQPGAYITWIGTQDQSTDPREGP